jgi:hypothetical protein
MTLHVALTLEKSMPSEMLYVYRAIIPWKVKVSDSLKVRSFPTLKDCKRRVVPTDLSSKVGAGEGTRDGRADGESVGDRDGSFVGLGVMVGIEVRSKVGAGDIVGARVGLLARVGAAVGSFEIG